MKTTATLLAALCIGVASLAQAREGDVPQGITPLDHVFLIVMENHGYSQIISNPNAPFINRYARQANLATNYFAIGHPSLTNYLEIVGGSNFGVQSDNDPDWHNAACSSNLQSGTINTDHPVSPPICPISGQGSDAPTPVIDTSNVAQSQPGEVNIDGIHGLPVAHDIDGKTIADQLTAAGKTWKSYQEDAPAFAGGIDGVNYSDGVYSNQTDFAGLLPAQNPPLTKRDIVALYAAKHNPFVYFRSIQEGALVQNSLNNTKAFAGPHGLYADLARGDVPHFAFIVPNQCNDQHGRSNAGAFCNYDPQRSGTQADLNPALIQRGDVALERLIEAIKASSVWPSGHNAIIVVWDENDYSMAPNTNQVVTIVDTNYGDHHLKSSHFYTHFSLLKSIESGLSLPCLNHACDQDVPIMADLFAASTPDAPPGGNHQ